MIKRFIQRLIPTPILNRYKRGQYFKILVKHSIQNEPDLNIARLLANKESIIVDIGANIGLYAKYLAPLSKKMICIEPVPFTFEMLKHNMRKLNFDNVETHQLAISNSAGSSTIEIPIQSGVRNYYRASLEQGEVKTIGLTTSVDTVTLDSFLKNISTPVSLIKCDVEGHELSVLEGATDQLKNGNAAWLIEISGNPDELNSKAHRVCMLMEESDFQTYWFDKKFLRERKKGDKSVNYFFLKSIHLSQLNDFLPL